MQNSTKPPTAVSTSKGPHRLGELLRSSGAVTGPGLDEALEEQQRAGGRLGEILLAHGVEPARLRDALATQLSVGTAERRDEPIAMLPSRSAHRLQAVVLQNGNGHAVPVAVADPSGPVLDALSAELARPVEPKLAAGADVDELIRRAYGATDVVELAGTLRERWPRLSASTPVARLHKLAGAAFALSVLVGLVIDITLTVTALVAAATALYVLTTGFRLFAAGKGWQGGAVFDVPAEELAALEEHELPLYTVLLPVYGEKESTLRELFSALAELDYPKHKLDCLLLLEENDRQTQEAVERIGCPGWLRRIMVRRGGPQTKPMAMLYGLRTARGRFVTVYDAEDKPDPLQLKRAVCAFREGGSRLVCLQAKLGYYNPRQNLLTKLFTLEYDAWFNLFLPGFACLGMPLPLGGTSNHFRRDSLEECLGWDPYNVTEDADLGVRFARSERQVGLLESTTYEEANSQVPSWIRQRSRWVKGYMQTVLVHFREPRELARQIGAWPAFVLALTMGGSVLTVLLTPVFWGLLVLWFVAEPAWLQELFPAVVYYPALCSLVLGNFALVFFGLVAAVGRRHDDLALVALCMPAYWLLMSAASYLAVIELVVRPYHWHKTEHGLHFRAAEAEA